MYFQKQHEIFSLSSFFNHTSHQWPGLKDEIVHQLTTLHRRSHHNPTRPFAFLLVFHNECWENLLKQIASIHALAWMHPIQLFAVNAAQDHLDHLAMLSYVTTHNVKIPEGDTFDFADLQTAIKTSLYVFPQVIYLPANRWLASDQLCNLDLTAWPFISRENTATHLDSHDSLNALLNHPVYQSIVTGPVDDNTQIAIYGSQLACILHHMLPMPSPDPEAKLDKAKPNVCLAISTYAREHADPGAFSLNTVVLTSLVRVLSEATYSAVNMHVYLGTQVGDHWDDHDWRSAVLSEARKIVNDRIQFHVHRYPLVGPLVDITVKYNMLIMQAYVDGCDYLYQYSDDTEFFDSARDWPLKMIDDFQQRRGFGTWGMTDQTNVGTMTLGASSRLHMELQGWFWPPVLKNWFSDNYIMTVYGPRFSIHRDDIWMQNKQSYGQRYNHCMHDLEMKLALIVSRARAVLWSSSKWPEWLPYFVELLQQSVSDFKAGFHAISDIHTSCLGHLAIRTIHSDSQQNEFDLLLADQALVRPRHRL